MATTEVNANGAIISKPTWSGMLIKSISPVSLFAIECRKRNLSCTTQADIWLTNFIPTIIHAMYQSHNGTFMKVINLQEQQITKIISAMLSNNAPKIVSALSLRATYPSAMSVIPQKA